MSTDLHFPLLLLLHVLSLGLSCAQNANSNCSSINTTLSERLNTCMNAVEDFLDCPDPSLCRVEEVSATRGIGVAFGIAIAGGVAAAIGSLVSLLPCLKPTDKRPLSAIVGFTVGSVLYISLSELLRGARSFFCCVLTAEHVDLAATGAFFIGVLLTFSLDILVRVYEKAGISTSMSSCQWRRRRRDSASVRSHQQDLAGTSLPLNNIGNSNGQDCHLHSDEGNLIETATLDRGSVTSLNTSGNGPNCSLPDNDRHIERRSISAASNAISSGTNQIGDISIQDLLSNTSIHRLNTVVPESVSASGEACSHVSLSLMNEDGSLRTAPSNMLNGDVGSRVSAPSNSLQLQRVDADSVQQQSQVTHDHTRHVATTQTPPTSTSSALRHAAVLALIATAVYNLPGGIALFIVSFFSSSSSFALGIVLMVLNLFESVCVSSLLYYATGSRLKAILCTFFLGAPLLLGAVISWLIAMPGASTVVYGACLALSSGMMVYLSLVALLPVIHCTAISSSSGSSSCRSSSRSSSNSISSVLVSLFVFIGMLATVVMLLLVQYTG